MVPYQSVRGFFMKKIFFIIFSLSVLLASCDSPGGSGGGLPSGIPAGVYIAGINNNRGIENACYWAGGRRVDLDGYSANSIAVLGSQVIVTGSYLTPSEDESDTFYPNFNGRYKSNPCYWIDGKRYSGSWEKKIIKSGKVYMLDTDGYRADGEKITIKIQGDSFYLADMAVSENGTVYVAGHFVGGKGFFYADGQLVELQGYEDWYSNFGIKGIAVSQGKVYVWSDFFDIREYWVNGVKFPLYFSDSEGVENMAVKNGIIYMVGGYRRGDTLQACYWADGERHDLSGLYATAIYAEE